MAQEITGSDDVKHYLVASIASAPKWDRAISVASNQGYETLLSEPDEFKPDPNPIRETSSKQQENYLCSSTHPEWTRFQIRLQNLSPARLRTKSSTLFRSFYSSLLQTVPSYPWPLHPMQRPSSRAPTPRSENYSSLPIRSLPPVAVKSSGGIWPSLEEVPWPLVA